MFRGRLGSNCGSAPRRSSTSSGGARRDRTDDLMLAKHALSQLSYGPVTRRRRPQAPSHMHSISSINLHSINLVGLGRLELPTSRLSSARSNQLSYKPQRSPNQGIEACSHAPDLRQTRRTAQPLARVRPRRKRNEDGEIPPDGAQRSGDRLAPECF
jgi:hypothetical protein